MYHKLISDLVIRTDIHIIEVPELEAVLLVLSGF